MSNLELFISDGRCVACSFVKEIIGKNNLPVKINTGGYHPLVNSHPTLVIDETSVVKGAVAIEGYLNTYLISNK